MRQHMLKLDRNYQRPVVILENGILALLDTGALMPVWMDDEEILVQEFHAKLFKKKVSFSGFGGTTQGNLYIVNMEIGGLIFPNMPIIANSEIQAPFHLILSATMLNGLRYQVDDIQHVLNIEIPDTGSIVRNIKVRNKAGDFIVLSSDTEGM